MKQNTVQLTVRGVPEDVVRVLRKRAELSGQSLNKTLVNQLSKGVPKQGKQDVFEELFGANTLGDDFDEILKEMRKPDPKLWD